MAIRNVDNLKGKPNDIKLKGRAVRSAFFCDTTTKFVYINRQYLEIIKKNVIFAVTVNKNNGIMR